METTLASTTIDILGLAYNGSTPVLRIKSGGTPRPVYSTPFYVENITQQSETLIIAEYNWVESGCLEIPVQYSTDGTTWSLLGTTGDTSLTRTLQPGDKVYLRATTNAWYEHQDEFSHGCAILGVSKVGGNIMSLLYGSSFTGNETTFPTGSTANFNVLFRDNRNLVSASELILPATILTAGCYSYMFQYCESLTTAPELPATTLVSQCYRGMFEGCANLNYIKCLAINKSASHCTLGWVNGVAASGTFVKDPNMSEWTWGTGDNGIPSGWEVEDATE